MIRNALEISQLNAMQMSGKIDPPEKKAVNNNTMAVPVGGAGDTTQVAGLTVEKAANVDKTNAIKPKQTPVLTPQMQAYVEQNKKNIAGYMPIMDKDGNTYCVMYKTANAEEPRQKKLPNGFTRDEYLVDYVEVLDENMNKYALYSTICSGKDRVVKLIDADAKYKNIYLSKELYFNFLVDEMPLGASKFVVPNNSVSEPKFKMVLDEDFYEKYKVKSYKKQCLNAPRFISVEKYGHPYFNEEEPMSKRMLGMSAPDEFRLKYFKNNVLEKLK